ncbi:uncharacterized protein C8Q71DRAFT_706044 [Rhodofomes roseus]|uniref:DUF4440 domain-containing protein n=1 Tax=Rhodofomes roseus TaxID=34475 RepID=A0ABQ8KJF7_9APHY|nr:uncharacterized protein C8Q71DRAFT_706044 [Rhodofomes roseus]KAH9837639.1 hypothetical protein C8Q71DRAFT_706044 [Rhodofomes roseus]
MSSNHGISPAEPLPLTTWIQDRISALYQATTEAAFNEAFDVLLHQDAQIYVNGARLTRVEYKRQVQEQKLVEHSATLTFSNAVQVQGKSVDLNETGSVGVFYKATIYENALVGAGRMTNIITSSLNAM